MNCSHCQADAATWTESNLTFDQKYPACTLSWCSGAKI